MKPVALLSSVLCILSSGAAIARERPQLDAFYDSGRALAVGRQLSPRAQALVREGVIAHSEPRLGVPTFFWAPRAETVGSLRAAGLTVEQAARRYLYNFADLYRIAPITMAEATLEKLHDTGRGGVIATFRADVAGVPVFRDSLQVLMTRDLQLVALTGYLSPHVGAAARSALSFPLDRKTALASAYSDLTGVALSPQGVVDGAALGGGYTALSLGAGVNDQAPRLLRPARARKVLFPLADKLEPAYHLELNVGDTEPDFYAYVISAIDGRILFRHNLTADATYRVFADNSGDFAPYDGPQGNDASPHPTGTPDKYQAPFVAPQLVTLNALPAMYFSKSATDPWLPAGATELTGNNVDAYADLGTPNGYSPGTADLRAPATGAGVFDYTFNPLGAPDTTAQRQAAITQLFYTVNWHHDFYYDKGYNEASGNSQQDNYGRGGLAGDRLNAEAQDYSSRNNANMATPADGSPPRMQMFVFDGNPERKVSISQPASVKGDYAGGVAAFGPKAFSRTGSVVLVNDGSTTGTGGVPGTVNDGCQSPFTSVVSGKIALLERGSCPFALKVANAQRNGAIGVLLQNNADGDPPGMAKSNTADDDFITIPVLSITKADGTKIRAALGSVTVTTLFRAAAIDRDGTMDNAIVAHEWGHSISNRLIGNSSGLSNIMGRGMGEGWGDFHALLMVTKPSDGSKPGNPKYAGAYALAGYTSSGGGNNGYYYGIRRQPYSTNMAIDGLTYGHIADGAELPASTRAGGVNSEVHNTGEVWATMLWECYVGLINDTARLTFEQARDRMAHYLVQSYKLTPNAPTLTEARDAVLSAAAAGDPADFAIFAKAFAKRGAGILAVAPSRTSTNNTPVVESFELGGELAYVDVTLDDSALYCDHDGVLDNGETGKLTITLKNTGTAELTSTTGTVTSSSPGVSIVNGTVTFPAAKPFTTTKAVVQVKLTGATKVTPLAFNISVTDPGLAVAGNRTTSFEAKGNFDIAEGTSATDDVESPNPKWVVKNADALPGNQWNRRKVGDGYLWFGPDAPQPTDAWLISPELKVASSGSFSFTFSNRWSFESNFDGGVLELSEDNGATWKDIGASASPGYNGTIVNTAGTKNPLKGRAAFVGSSSGYPAFVNTTVSLGTTYAGKTVKVRFRIGSDDAEAAVGWELDQLAFSNLSTKPFATLVTDTGGACLNRPPNVTVGAAQTVDAGATVTLDGSAIDPDGDAITYAWKQTAGPAVTLQGAATRTAQFTAPTLEETTKLVFALVASDGKLPSDPGVIEVTVNGRNSGSNRKPIADAGSDRTSEPSSYVQLNGRNSADPDGDTLTYKWKQTGGTPVTLSSDSDAQPSFTTPSGESVLTFSLVVNDGLVDSDPATVTVTIEEANHPRPGCASTGGAPLALLAFAVLAMWAARRPRLG